MEELKRKLSSQPVLAILNEYDLFRVETDSSNYALGAVLSQKQNGIWQPIAFRSQSLNPAERNYEIYDKEMLAIVEAIKDQHQYLLGVRQTFKVQSDHTNLTYFKASHKLNYRQACQRTELADYDFVLTHKPGKTLAKADTLSRTPQFNKGEHDNKDVTFIKANWLRGIVYTGNNVILQKILNAQKELQDKGEELLAGIQLGGDYMYWKSKIYVPSNTVPLVLKEYHDSLLVGHPGYRKTLEMIQHEFWWPQMRTEVKQYVQGCDKCQRTKSLCTTRQKALHPHDTPARP